MYMGISTLSYFNQIIEKVLARSSGFSILVWNDIIQHHIPTIIMQCGFQIFVISIDFDLDHHQHSTHLPFIFIYKYANFIQIYAHNLRMLLNSSSNDNWQRTLFSFRLLRYFSSVDCFHSIKHDWIRQISRVLSFYTLPLSYLLVGTIDSVLWIVVSR